MNALEHTTESVAKRLQLCLPRLAPQLTNPFAPLAELALDSIDSVELLCVIHDEFGVRLTESEFHPRQTVGGLLSHRPRGQASMTYGDYLTTSEMTRWVLDTDIDWDAIDPVLALTQPELLDRVRDSALIESFFPIFTPRALDLLWDNVTATAIYSIQLYESYKHFHAFAQYLEAVGYRVIAEEEIVALRRRNLGLKYDQPARLLTRYMMSEHFAAHHFFKDSRHAAEPVLRHILQLVAKDEVRHCQFGYELLDDHLRRHPEDVDEVLDEATHFKHIGELVLPAMPVAQKNDFAAILAINRKIERLTGQGISAHLSEVLA